jgi:predicted PurR-regulated permease PerM
MERRMPVDEEQRLRARAGDDGFVRRVVLAVLIAGALVTLGLLLWALVDVLLLVFGAVLVATMLHALADPIARRTPLSRTAALPLAALVILAVVGTAVWLFHAQVSGQIVDAVSKAQSGLPALAERLGVPGLAGQIVDTAHRVLSGDALLGRVTTVGATVLEATTNLVLVVFGGAYLAAAPTVYRDGVVKLFPAAARPRVGETLDTAGRALKLWLLGQAAAMIVTGALTWLGLWIIGVPSAAGLGLIAGVMELIPLVGPFLAAVPAILVALSQDASMAAWTVLVFILVQQVESNLLQPLIMREAVAIPPALLLFAVVAFGVLFGILGIVFAAPLAVLSYVAITKLYVRETLGERATVPGED